jgi:predicted RNA binding protein with dsRBD fold (UPF0201 family)
MILSCSVDESVFGPTLVVEDFSTTISERPSENFTLGKIHTSTKLEDLSYILVNQSEANALRIDSETGELIVNDETLFDINNLAAITAEVLVTSGDLTQLADIVINLELSETTISYFKDIALGFEFGNASQITRKWKHDMKIFVGGSPTSDLYAELNAIISDIDQLTSKTFSMEVVSDTLMSNFYIYFGSGNSYAQIFPSNSSLVDNNWGLFSVYWNGLNELNSGHMYVDIYRASPLEQRHLLREELTQSLGLAKDSPLYSESIFQQAFSTKTTEYAEIDKDLIYLLYHPAMQTGLNSSQVDSKLREILRAEW